MQRCVGAGITPVVHVCSLQGSSGALHYGGFRHPSPQHQMRRKMPCALVAVSMHSTNLCV